MITTRMTGRLPNLDIEIIRRETDDGREAVGITFIATPTLGQAALNLLANPAALALAAFRHPATRPTLAPVRICLICGGG